MGKAARVATTPDETEAPAPSPMPKTRAGAAPVAVSPSAPASTEREIFLGVARSAKGLCWYDRLPADRRSLATAISQRHDLPELLGRLLAARGIGLDEVGDVLDPRLKALMPDPDTLQDMTRGAERIAEAIIARAPIAIFGDYDVDGATSSALMHRFLSAHGLQARIYIPDRLFEGYGPNPDAIAKLIDDGAKLIITVDCGSTSHAALQVAADRGIDVVVIDHHQADELLPPVHSVINPNRQDDLSGLGHLCAAGVVFMTLVATFKALRTRGHYGDKQREPKLLEWLDLVALGTVCDVVPLEGLNRAFVRQGLQVMRHRKNPGLTALSDAAGLASAPAPYHLGFLLGPRINAGGRIGDSGLGAQLLSIDDPKEAERIAEVLDRLNRERKAMETEILEAARAAADAAIEAQPDLPIVVAGSKDWHKGLVGLVASRLTEQFGRPSCVIAWTDKGEGTGSLRSIPGVDIGGIVRAATADGLLIKGGGHAMAAGLTVHEDKFDALQAYFRERLDGSVSTARGKAGIGVDGALTPAAANRDFMDLLDRAGPFGSGNPTPRFVFPSHIVRNTKVVGENHVRITLEAGDRSRIDGIAFRALGTPIGDMLLSADGLPRHVAGTLKRDTWGGREKIDLMIDDVADPAAQPK